MSKGTKLIRLGRVEKAVGKIQAGIQMTRKVSEIAGLSEKDDFLASGMQLALNYIFEEFPELKEAAH